MNKDTTYQFVKITDVDLKKLKQKEFYVLKPPTGGPSFFLKEDILRLSEDLRKANYEILLPVEEKQVSKEEIVGILKDIEEIHHPLIVRSKYELVAETILKLFSSQLIGGGKEEKND